MLKAVLCLALICGLAVSAAAKDKPYLQLEKNFDQYKSDDDFDAAKQKIDPSIYEIQPDVVGPSPTHLPVPEGFTLENNADRLGSDYAGFDVAGDWIQCNDACASQAQCLAWTWVRPGVQGASARCYLKNRIPYPRPSTCCISGLRLEAAPVLTQYDIGVDRPGSDYDSFDMPSDSTAITCARACSADGRCASWTFVMPGIQSAYPRCWLKNAIPNAVSSNCCSSGVK